MKFIHCADVHLDTPLQGLAQFPGAPVNEIRSATRRAFEKVIEAALAEQIDFLVIAGDLYDVGLKSFESALFFTQQVTRLKDAGIEVYLIHGNHDAENKLTKSLRRPSNLHVFRSNEPQTFKNEKLRVAIHGQSFATAEITADLAAGYPPALPNYFNIGVLHTNLSGISEHANYAPCSLETLKNKGYQYWALGHVHNREVLCTDPYIVYPGNIQGRNGKEQGAKGCELVTVSDSGSISMRTVPTSVVPWTQIEIDASGCTSSEDVYDRIRQEFAATIAGSEESVTALRVRISGVSAAHTDLNRDPELVRNEVRNLAVECGQGQLWVERVQVATLAALDRESLLMRDDPIGEVLRIASALRRNQAALEERDSIMELRRKLPSELAQGPEFDGSALAVALDEAEALLLARLSAVESL
jgi:DNA repair exonuclease SbcCD nuclease subunit